METVIQTEWIVLTGGYCAGKSTTIDLFAELGFPAEPEINRVCFQEESAKGKTQDEILSDSNWRIRATEIQWEKESALARTEPNTLRFLDRALPDRINSYQKLGIGTAELLEACRHIRYRQIFKLDLLPYEADGVRPSRASAEKMDREIKEIYESLGYVVLTVPVMTPNERFQVIVTNLSPWARQQIIRD